jgi:hypothetical protein
MKALLYSVFHKLISFFRKLVRLFRKVGPFFHKLVSSLAKLSPFFRKLVSFLHRVGSLFRSVGSLLGKLGRKLWRLPPCQRIDHALQRIWKRTIPLRYRFLPYVISVLRVLAWVVLVIGVLASLLLGVEIMDRGLTVSNTQLTGVGTGIAVIVLGIVGSFLGWLFLLVSRELVQLFIHVNENTRNTAQSIGEESG